MIFLKTLHIKIDAPWGTPQLKNEVPQLKNKPQPLKSEAPFRKWFLEKESEKSETGINLCFTHKITLAEIPQKCDFLTWSIQNFLRRKKLWFLRVIPPWNAKAPHRRSVTLPKILNISLLKGCCLDWQCFLNWLGSSETFPGILKCFDSAVLNWS